VERPDCGRAGHQPNAHPGHNPIVGLRGQAVEDGTETVLRGMSVEEVGAFEGAVTGLQHLTVAQHLHSANAFSGSASRNVAWGE
jgi:hypothetical protein